MIRVHGIRAPSAYTQFKRLNHQLAPVPHPHLSSPEGHGALRAKRKRERQNRKAGRR